MSNFAGDQMNRMSLKAVARVFRALSEPNRLELLNALRSGAKSVGELVEITGLNQANVSKQLKVLRERKFISRTKNGRHSFYHISDPTIFDLCDLVCNKLRSRFISEE